MKLLSESGVKLGRVWLRSLAAGSPVAISKGNIIWENLKHQMIKKAVIYLPLPSAIISHTKLLPPNS